MGVRPAHNREKLKIIVLLREQVGLQPSSPWGAEGARGQEERDIGSGYSCCCNK